MQGDFDKHYPSSNIQILGLNEAGLGSNELITEGRNLPWLQDVDANNNEHLGRLVRLVADHVPRRGCGRP